MSSHNFFKRMLRSGMQQVWRNSTVTIASVLVTTVTLLIISLALFTNAVLVFSLEEIAKKVDVNIYFYPTATEQVVFEVRDALQNLPEVAELGYISREEAIETFRERHRGDSLTLQALEELGDNPLGPALNIRAHDPSQYESIAQFLAPSGGLTSVQQALIEKVNYQQNELIIKKISGVMDTVRTLGMVIAGVFMALSVLITINTVRLAIYASREEISIMQMVGADRRFVQGPFFIAGMFYGLVSAAITIIVLYPTTVWIARMTTSFFGGLNLFDYYIANFIWLGLIIFVVGILIGLISSALAVRAYLK